MLHGAIGKWPVMGDGLTLMVHGLTLPPLARRLFYFLLWSRWVFGVGIIIGVEEVVGIQDWCWPSLRWSWLQVYLD